MYVRTTYLPKYAVVRYLAKINIVKNETKGDQSRDGRSLTKRTRAVREPTDSNFFKLLSLTRLLRGSFMNYFKVNSSHFGVIPQQEGQTILFC